MADDLGFVPDVPETDDGLGFVPEASTAPAGVMPAPVKADIAPQAASATQAEPSTWESIKSAVSSTAKDLTTSSNWTKNQWVSDKEVTDVAKKYGVSKQVLELSLDAQHAARELDPTKDYTREDVKRVLAGVAGLPNVATGGAIAKGMRQAFASENTQRAIDEILQMGNDRKDYTQKSIEMLLPAPLAFSKAGAAVSQIPNLAKRTAAIAALATPAGAMYGYGGSKTGEEVESTITGALVGAGAAVGLTLAGAGVGAVAGLAKGSLAKRSDRLAKLAEEAEPITRDISATSQHDIIYNANIAYEKNSKKEADIAKTIMQSIKKEELDNPFIGKEIMARKFDDEELAAKAYEKTKSRYMSMHDLPNSPAGEYEAELAISNSLLTKERYKLAKSIDERATVKTADEVLNAHMAGLGTGEEGLLARQKAVATHGYALDHLEKTKDEYAAKSFGVDIEDRDILPHAVAEKADAKTGTTLSGHVSDVINALEKVNLETKAHVDAAKELIERTGKLTSLRGQDGGKLLAEIIDMGESRAARAVPEGLITKEELALAREWASFYNDVGEELNAKGLSFPRMKAEDGSANYMPRRIRSNEEVRSTLMREYENVMPAIEKRNFDLLRDFTPDPEKVQKLKTTEELQKYLEELKAKQTKKDKEIDKMTDFLFREFEPSANEIRQFRLDPDDIEGSLAKLDPARRDELIQKLRGQIVDKLDRERDFITALSISSGKRIGNKQEIYAAINEIKDNVPSVTKRLNNARATMQRKGEIPELIREHDFAKIAQGYIADNFKHIALKEPVARVKEEIAVLDKMGAKGYRDYFDTWISDLLSGKEKSITDRLNNAYKDKYTKEIVNLQKEKQRLVAEVMAQKPAKLLPEDLGAYARVNEPRIEELENKIATLRFKQEVPEAIGSALRNNFMGTMLAAKPKQAIRDLYQPYTMGIQEIGGKYGVSVMKDATLEYFKNPRSLKAMEEELTQLGHVSKEFSGQMSSSREALDMYSEWAKFGEEKAKKMVHYLNVFRRSAEIINRNTMLNAARKISSDFMTAAPSKEAKRFIEERLAPAYKTRIRLAQSKNELTQDQLTKWITDDLIAKTQFRYHPAMKSARARELGPFFTQFTQYPAGVASSLSLEARRRGTKAAITRGLAPVIGLATMSRAYDALTSRDEEEGLSDREKLFLYTGGVEAGAPVAALPGLVVGQGPSAKLTSKTATLLSNMITADIDVWGPQLGKLAAQVGGDFSGYSLYSGVLRDLITLGTGEAPDMSLGGSID